MVWLSGLSATHALAYALVGVAAPAAVRIWAWLRCYVARWARCRHERRRRIDTEINRSVSLWAQARLMSLDEVRDLIGEETRT